MTTSPTEAHAGDHAAVSSVRPYVAPTGIAAWITTGDHKRIGRLYAGFALLFGMATAVVGALLSLERVDESSKVVLQADSVAQLFHLYRHGLVFLAGLPLLLGVAIAVVPLQVGARGIAFPRAAALSFWTWLIGGGLMIGAYAANGGPGGGDSEAVSLFLVSFTMVLVALVIAGVCLATTVLTGRAAGMKLEQAPAFAWAAMVTGAGLVISLPVVIGNLIMMTIDHRYGQQLFGGNAGVAKYIDMAVRQPQSYLYVVPVLGIVADIVATATKTRQALRGPLLAAIGLAGILGVGVDIQASVNPDVRNQFLFIAGSVAFVLPVVMTLGWVALALKSSRIKATGGLVLGIFSLLLLAAAALLGALTGFERLGLVDSSYELGHLNLVIGAGILGGLAGLAHWWPKLSGRLVADALVKLIALPAAGAVVLMGVMDIVMGLADEVPADTVKDTGSSLAQTAGAVGLIGQLLLLVVVLGFAGLLFRASKGGDAAGDDPWDGQTLEWATPSPAPADNFDALPVVHSAEPLLDLKHAGKDA